MKRALVLLVSFVLLAGLAAYAGDEPDYSGKAPKIIRIMREEIRPGHMASHDQVVRATIKSYGDMKFPGMISAQPVGGNANEINHISFASSYTELAEMGATQSKAIRAAWQDPEYAKRSTDAHQSTKFIVASLMPKVSYGLDKFDPAQYQAWEVTYVRYKPGTQEEVMKALTDVADLHRKNNIDETYAYYYVNYGAQDGTIIVLHGLKSLADLDNTADMEKIHSTVFTPTIRRGMRAASENIVYSETSLLMVRPEVSNPPEAYRAANPGFWNVKADEPAVATVPAKKVKKAEKSVQAISMKQ